MNKVSQPKITFDLHNVDWNRFSSRCEQLLPSDISHISSAEEIWDVLLQTINTVKNEELKLKCMCKHSKPYWNDNLSNLSLLVRNAKKRFKRFSTYHNEHLYKEAKENFSTALAKAMDTWMYDKLDTLNTQDQKSFWKQHKSMFGDTKNNGVEILKKDGILIFDHKLQS